uniref:Gypsy retrotransposon integrase-like protein 1 n=1 Tax=Oryzias melastigma TaxID=30732 RepID=A0A3B3CC70_ORYME
MRMARWSARLLCYNYDVVYRPGSENCIADCLSRLPLSADQDACADSEPEFVAMLSAALTAVSPADFASASSSCPELSALRLQLMNGFPRSSAALPENLRPYFRLREEFSVQHDYVFRGSRLVVPVSLRHQLIILAHEGHQGNVRTKQRLRDLYWWPGMDDQVTQHVKGCQLCQSCDKTALPAAAPLVPVPFPSLPWEKVAIDVVGPFETAVWDCRYAITMVDYHSKWPEVGFAASVTSETVISFLSSVFSRFGNPQTVVSDNGSQFTSAEFAAFLRSRDIKHIRTSVYHPAANGAVERFHRVLKSCIQGAILEKKSWRQTVTNFLQVYRSTPHSTTEVSPCELLLGRKMRTRLHVLLPDPQDSAVTRLADSVAAKQNKMKLYTDKRRGARVPTFQEGECVRVRKPTHVLKSHPRFSEPLRVMKQLAPGTYLLEDGRKWHASRLAHSNIPAKKGFESPALDLLHVDTPDVVQPNTAAQAPVITGRVRRPPRWLEDYVK